MIHKLQQIAQHSGFSGIIKRIFSKILREHRKLTGSMIDNFSGSYTLVDTIQNINSLMNQKLLREGIKFSIPKEVLSNYLNHRFDLLGSGWVQVKYGTTCRGLEGYQYTMSKGVKIDSEGDWLKSRINHSNLKKAQELWKHVDKDYSPVDWQLDFKSGYRWSEKTWSKKIKFENTPGVDIKVPWELARMQHLPQLALVCLCPEVDRTTSGIIQKEYKNQIIDFIATNPPAYGVNWVCPMDVAIRAANWLLAWELFKSGEALFDASFESILATSVYEHGLYLIKNLENTRPRANHYLANIAGLAFIAAYLPASSETDAWLAFSIKELLIEVEQQFYSEGSNVEGSTAYHRLSTEMIYFTTALILGLPQKRQDDLIKTSSLPLYAFTKAKLSFFSENYFRRLEQMAEFIMNITKPDGFIPQIGDNDSGRFFKLAPVYQCINVREAKETWFNLGACQDLDDNGMYFMENHLDCSHLIYAAAGLFEQKNFINWFKSKKNPSNGLFEKQSFENMADTVVSSALQSGLIIPSKRPDPVETISIETGTDEDFNKILSELKQVPEHHIRRNSFTIANAYDDLVLCAYPQFGLYLITSPLLYLAIRCWIGDQPEHTSHRHQDQLSVELSIDGHNIIRDPGTWLYTPQPAQRHYYRSNSAHFSPFTENEYSFHIFGPITIEPVKVRYFGKRGFAAETTNLKKSNHLIVSLKENAIEIFRVNHLIETTDLFYEDKLLFSPGYGIKQV